MDIQTNAPWSEPICHLFRSLPAIDTLMRFFWSTFEAGFRREESAQWNKPQAHQALL
jgi:hypothetical protein